MFKWTDLWIILRLLLDIAVVWTLIYAGMRIIRNNNRTIQIVKGILALFLLKLIAQWLQLNAVSYLLDIFLNWGVLFVLVILQPEIRSMLEKVGKVNSPYNLSLPRKQTEKLINELVKAAEQMSETKTGALISLQMNQSLEDHEKSGIPLDSVVSAELLETLFQYGTPMHDGAVIIDGDRIACGAAYFPSTTRDLPSRYGARHRAAVGISEITDSVTLVVSEETGNISVARHGELTQYTPEALHRYLTSLLIDNAEQPTGSVFQPVIDTARSFSTTLANRREEKGKKDDRKRDERITPIEVCDCLRGEKEKE